MKNLSSVRIAILPLYDIFQVNRSSNGKTIIAGGFLLELLDMAVRSLKVPFEIIIPEDKAWGIKREDGNWTGLVGMLVRDEADIGFANFFMSENRLEVVDYSYPFTILPTGFATGKPGVLHSSLTFIYPFEVCLWIALISTLLCLPVILKYAFSNRYTFQDWLFQLLGSVFRQPVSIRSNTFTDRLLLLSVTVGAFFISVSYSSVLLSFLTVPLREIGIKDVKSLAAAVKSKTTKLYALETSGPKVLSHHSDEDVRYLMNKIIDEKMILKSDPNVLSENILKKKNALMGSYVLLRTSLDRVNYIISDSVFSTLPVSVIMKKDFKFKEEINTCIHRCVAFAIYQRSLDHFFFRKEKQFDIPNSDSEIQITLEELNGAFIALLAGYVLSICIFFAELVFFRFANNK